MSQGPGAYNVDYQTKNSLNSCLNLFLFESPKFKSSKSDKSDITSPGAYNLNSKSVMHTNIIQLRSSSDVSFKYNTN